MKAFLAILVIFFLIGAGIYFGISYLTPQQPATGEGALTESGVAPEAELPPPPDYAPTDFSWSVQPAPGSSDTQPDTFLSLVVKDKTISVGKYTGCNGLPSTETLEPGEVARTSCWWAGAGDDISVFKENDRFWVKHRMKQEVPPDVDAPSHSEFATLFRVD